jgi:hypothetical protein
MKKIFIIFIISYIYAQPDEFQFVATNLGGVIQGTPRINDVRASSSDWVAAFDANGNCAGAGQLVWVAGDVRFNFIVYGDDITSPAVDEGMSSTENFTLKLWDESLNVIIEETNESGNPIYHSGWQSTNFTPIVGYNDPYQEYSFNVNNVDPVILGISLDEKYEDINFDITIDNISFLDEDGVSDEYLTLTLIDSSGNDGNQLSSDQNNYTINGNSVILNENYNGEIVIGMIIDDGFSSSEIYFANIEVLPINDNPFIVSQNIGNQTVFEDSFFVVDVSDFVIEDVDNIAPIATSQIVVNEFLAASDNCCMSPDGNYEDFVELYNGTSESININGWGFSDTEGEVSTIAPDTSIASGDFLVLWFTGDDDGFPEIDSKLSSDGETIYIEDSDGNVVINYSFSSQETDISYGRVFDGSNTWGTFSNPSPGYSNVSQELDIVLVEGQHYSVSGDTIFPSPNYDGNPLNVYVYPIDDQGGAGETFTFNISIIPINDPPSIIDAAIYPSIPGLSDTLSLSYIVSDIEGSNDTTLYISWFKNDEIVYALEGEELVNPEMTNCLETWRASIVAYDGEDSSGVYESNAVTICGDNTAPEWSESIETISVAEDDSVIIDLSNYITDLEQADSQLSFHSDSTDVSGIIETEFIGTALLKIKTVVENYFTPTDSVIQFNIWADDGLGGIDTTTIFVIINPINDAPSILNVPLYVINEDSHFVFNIDSISYIDVDNLVITHELTSGENYFLRGDSILPDLNFNGLLVVPFSISDGEHIDNDTLIISVIPSNDLPLEFSLIGPESGDTVYVNYSNQNYNLTFNWEEAVDLDGDSVSYNFTLLKEIDDPTSDSLSMTVYTDFIDVTEYQMSYMDFIEIIEEYSTNNKIELYWAVSACDSLGCQMSYLENEGLGWSLFIDASAYLSIDDTNKPPDQFTIFPAYPNPFNNTIEMRVFSMQGESMNISIYNLMGQKVKTLISENIIDGGYKTFRWNGTDASGQVVSSGMYIVNIIANDIFKTQKILFLK